MTGANGDQGRATLHHLKQKKVVDALEADGQLWWFLTGEDQRTKAVEERVPESPGSRAPRKKPGSRPRKEQPG